MSWVNLSRLEGAPGKLTISQLKERIKRHEATLKVGFLDEKARARRELTELRTELDRRLAAKGPLRVFEEKPLEPLRTKQPAPKAVELGQGAWTCPVEPCSTENDETRARCRNCGQPRGVVPPGPHGG